MDFRKWGWVAVVTVLALAAASVAMAAENKPSTTGTKKKTVTYIVVQVKNTQGEVSFEVINALDLPNRVKGCKDQYKEALKQWNDAKAAAKKNKEVFTDKKPVEPYVRQVGPRFTSQEKAKEYADKMRKEYEAEHSTKKVTETDKPKVDAGTKPDVANDKAEE